MTNLESEVNKTGFYDKNQYGLHWTLSSTGAKSLHDRCTVTPAISSILLHAESPDPVDPATATYHNRYAIIIVVMAFVAMESAKLAAIREVSKREDN